MSLVLSNTRLNALYLSCIMITAKKVLHVGSRSGSKMDHHALVNKIWWPLNFICRLAAFFVKTIKPGRQVGRQMKYVIEPIHVVFLLMAGKNMKVWSVFR